MRFLPAGVPAVSLLLGASTIAAVSDPLARQASDVLAKESKFNRVTRAKPVIREFGAMLRGSNLDFGFPPSSELDYASKAFEK